MHDTKPYFAEKSINGKLYALYGEAAVICEIMGLKYPSNNDGAF